MGAYIAKRSLQGVVVLLVVAFLCFLIFQYLGDPVVAMAGKYATQGQMAQMRTQLGLDAPFYVQFVRFFGNALQGDFGISYVSRIPALGLILERLPATIELAFVAQVVAVIIGVSLGVLSAARPESPLSKVAQTASLFGISLPTFLLGILLILVFAVLLPWLPPFGRGEVITIWGRWQTGLLTADGLKHLILPALTLAGLQIALLFRLTRSGMIEALQTDYVRTARAKGVNQRAVLFKHALRNVSIPVVTIIGLQFGQLIGFSIVTETIFQWPGAGNLLLTSIYESDFPLMVTYIMIVALVVVLLNIMVDVAYTILNPKIRYG